MNLPDSLFSPVHNRGAAPREFLETLVTVMRGLPDEIFSRSYRGDETDIYDDIFSPDFNFSEEQTRAVMCEVLRVLGGFESSWRWNEGRDVTNASSNTPLTEEAGIFQVSANSMNFDPSLKGCVRSYNVEPTPANFIHLMKTNKRAAIEYCARLLRFTIRHHGPLVRGEVFPFLRQENIAAFQALLDGTPTPQPPMQKLIPIMLDPGHGGTDSGAVGELPPSNFENHRVFTEKEIVLQVAKNLKKRLDADGRFLVSMTRTDDTFTPLNIRAAVANSFAADLISIHANAGGGTGFECFTSPGQTQSDLWAGRLLDSYAVMFPDFTGRFDIQDGDKDKEAKFTVLTKTLNRAVLFELGFMDRQEDLKRMTDPTFAGRAAEALYIGTCRFYGLEPKEIPDTVVEDPDDSTPKEEVPVEDLAGAFLSGYEKAIEQLVKRREGLRVALGSPNSTIEEVIAVARAFTSAADAVDLLSHPTIRKAAGLPAGN